MNIISFTMMDDHNHSYSLADRAWHGLKDRGVDQVDIVIINDCCHHDKYFIMITKFHRDNELSS